MAILAAPYGIPTPRRSCNPHRAVVTEKRSRFVDSVGIEYVVAIGLPIVGVVLGVIRLSKQDIGNGLGLVITSVVSFLIVLAIVTS
jgi:hypothetical protein